MARLTDQPCVVAYIRSLTSGVEGEADILDGAPFQHKLIPTCHPHSSSGFRLTGHSRRTRIERLGAGVSHQLNFDWSPSCHLSVQDGTVMSRICVLNLLRAFGAICRSLPSFEMLKPKNDRSSAGPVKTGARPT